MSVFAKIPQLNQPEVLSTVTASATSAIRPYLRTVDATTNFVVGGAHIITITLKTVDSSGTAVQGAVRVDTLITAGTTLANNAFAATPGTLVSNQNGATTPASWPATFITSTAGLLTAVITTAGAGTATVVVTYGNQQVIVTGLTVNA